METKYQLLSFVFLKYRWKRLGILYLINTWGSYHKNLVSVRVMDGALNCIKYYQKTMVTPFFKNVVHYWEMSIIKEYFNMIQNSDFCVLKTLY